MYYHRQWKLRRMWVWIWMNEHKSLNSIFSFFSLFLLFSHFLFFFFFFLHQDKASCHIRTLLYRIYRTTIQPYNQIINANTILFVFFFYTFCVVSFSLSLSLSLSGSLIFDQSVRVLYNRGFPFDLYVRLFIISVWCMRCCVGHACMPWFGWLPVFPCTARNKPKIKMYYRDKLSCINHMKST